MAGASEEIVTNKQVKFKNYVNEGCPKESDIFVSSNSIKPKIPEGTNGVLIKNLYFSCDAYMRILMKERKEKVEGFDNYKPGSPIYGFGVSKVIESSHPDYNIGDFVSGLIPWEEYSFISNPTPQTLSKIYHTDLPLSYHIGILGIPGITAYAGLHEIGAPKKGECVFVSAACGSIGQLVGQFAKLSGCYVVGSTGSKEKVDLLKNKLGFDEAFNYKEEQGLDAALKRCFPKGIDVYFDNIGGKILDAVLLNMKFRGRVVLCGMISQENLEQFEGIQNVKQLLGKCIRMEGFAVANHFHLFPKYLEMVMPKIKEGKIVYVEDIAHGIESSPVALVGLFTGRNVGKQVVKIADE